MSSKQPAAGASSTTTSPANDGGGGEDDWRASVEQAYRNSEVREIAKVLAGLEPGASVSSKLRLAMQFEDTVFKSATSLADYRKKLTKRLKKVQKSYVPTQKPASSTKETALLDLRQKYGEALRYIVKHGDEAVEQMKAKHGEEKAKQLKQHTDGVKVWAADLGLLDDNKGKPNVTMSNQQLEKLKGHLERRTENIRSHVVKLVDSNRFVVEMIEGLEQNAVEYKQSKILATFVQKRMEHLHDVKLNPMENFQEATEQVQSTVPLISARSKNISEEERSAALKHLGKMRAASNLLLAYMMVPEKNTLPRNSVLKAHTAAKEGIEYVTTVMKKYRKENEEVLGVTLEDAWMKPLVLPAPEESSSALETPNSKRLRTNSHAAPVVKSRVLLTPGRKTPSNLLLAFKRKRARLVRPEPRGEGSHLILDFGQAFVMTIYFCPLTVTLRALSPRNQEEAVSDRGGGYSNLECASWTPLYSGLAEQKELTVWGAKGSYESLGHVVEERLRDASCHATYVLRKCFENAAIEGANDFEVEIREATALLEFLQLSRTTFIPDWQDAE